MWDRKFAEALAMFLAESWAEEDLAGVADFTRASADCSGHQLQVCFTATTNRADEIILVTARAWATATFECLPHRGRRSQPPNTEVVVEEMAVSMLFSSDQTGQVTGCLVLRPPTPGNLRCCAEETRVLRDVTFTDIQITDKTNDACIRIPRAFNC